MERMDSVMVMEEMTNYAIKTKSRMNAIELTNLTTGWDILEVL